MKKAISGTDSQYSQEEVEIESVKCHCCGFTEECTPDYVAGVCEKYQGHWICGLCSEAINEETYRSERKISTDEAMKRLLKFREKLRISCSPKNSSKDLIVAMKQLLLRSLNSSRKEDLALRPLSPSQSCLATISESPRD